MQQQQPVVGKTPFYRNIHISFNQNEITPWSLGGGA
jgi:hypothetical protein